MSEQTYADLQSAIAAHIVDECDGDLIGSWVVVAQTTNLEEFEDGGSSFFTATPDHQSNFTTTGLLYRAMEIGSFAERD